MAFAPTLDFFSPDIYHHNYSETITHRRRNGHPLFITEQSRDAMRFRWMWEAFGTHGALAASPLGIIKVRRRRIEDPETNGFKVGRCCHFRLRRLLHPSPLAHLDFSVVVLFLSFSVFQHTSSHSVPVTIISLPTSIIIDLVLHSLNSCVVGRLCSDRFVAILETEARLEETMYQPPRSVLSWSGELTS